MPTMLAFLRAGARIRQAVTVVLFTFSPGKPRGGRDPLPVMLGLLAGAQEQAPPYVQSNSMKLCGGGLGWILRKGSSARVVWALERAPQGSGP